MYLDFKTINEITGFANGDKWEREEEIHDYFTVDTMRSIYPEWDIPAEIRELYPNSQAALDDMADAVIRNRWHMV